MEHKKYLLYSEKFQVKYVSSNSPILLYWCFAILKNNFYLLFRRFSFLCFFILPICIVFFNNVQETTETLETYLHVIILVQASERRVNIAREDKNNWILYNTRLLVWHWYSNYVQQKKWTLTAADCNSTDIYYAHRYIQLIVICTLFDFKM